MALVETDPIGGVIPAPPPQPQPDPPPPPGIITGGSSTECEVRLLKTFQISLTFTMTSTQPALITYDPPTVTIGAGKRTARVTIITNEVTKAAHVALAGISPRGLLVPFVLVLLPTDEIEQP